MQAYIYWGQHRRALKSAWARTAIRVLVLVTVLVTLPLHAALRALGRKGFYNVQRSKLRIDGDRFYPPQETWSWDINKEAFHRIERPKRRREII